MAENLKYFKVLLSQQKTYKNPDRKRIQVISNAMQYTNNVIKLLSAEEALRIRSMSVLQGFGMKTAAVYSLPKICQFETQGMLEHQLF
jgi:hypothetical protein